jgi:hypothetical protein
MSFPSPIVYPDSTLYPDFAAPATEGRKISLGGFVLGDTDGFGIGWTITKFDGWGSPQSTVNFTTRGRGHGATSTDPYHFPRFMTIEGLVHAPDLASLDAAFYRLSGAVTLDQFQLLVAEGAGIKQVAAQRQGEVVTTYLSNNLGKYSILIAAKDPFKYGDAVQVTTALPSTSGGRTFPAQYPVTYTGVTNSGVIQVNNTGNAPAPVYLRVDGVIPAGGWSVNHLDQKVNLSFATSLALGSGEFVTVDMQRREVLAQGQSTRNGWVTSRGWFQLDPGVNNIAFSATAYDPSALLTLTTYPAWS